MFYVFFAEGFEEIEAIAVVDILRRASIDVCTVGVGAKNVAGSHGMTVVCDKEINEINLVEGDSVVLPGGMPGTTNLYACDAVLNAVNFAKEKGNLVCAICAAPLILGRLGILDGKSGVCYPGFEDELKGCAVSADGVVVDGNVITGKGPGVALDFALAIVEKVCSAETAASLREGMQCR